MKADLAALRAFLQRYWFWMALVLVVNIAVWRGLEAFGFRALPPTERWPVRMYLLSGLLLFDNLCVLWWYADSTRRQMAATEEEVRENRLARWRENKPVVFVELSEYSFEGEDDENIFWDLNYVVSNSGNGPALNVFLLLNVSRPSAPPIAFGALGSHEQREIPHGSSGDFRYVVIAEGLSSRTRRWNATLNLGARLTVVHGLFDLGPDHTMGDDANQTLDQFLKQHRESMTRQLNALELPKQGADEPIEPPNG